MVLMYLPIITYPATEGYRERKGHAGELGTCTEIEYRHTEIEPPEGGMSDTKIKYRPDVCRKVKIIDVLSKPVVHDLQVYPC